MLIKIKATLLFLFTMCLLPLTVKCQFYLDEFEEEINVAESLYNDGKFAESALKYESALSIANNKYPQSGTYYNAVLALIEANYNKKKVYEYLENWIISSWADSTRLFNNPKFVELHDDVEWEKLGKYVSHRIAKYQDVQSQLIDIGELDQSLRLEAVAIQEKLGKTSEEYKNQRKTIEIQDSLNLINVEIILSKYGWLGRSTVGEKACNTLWKVIQHASDEIRRKYLPLIEESVAKGETPHSKLALLQDRLLINQGKEQLYGSQFFTDKDTGEVRVFPIQDHESINERRNSIGMSDIETYLRYCGIDTITINTFSDSVAIKLLSTYRN